jgi:hypothetical protein
MQQFIDHLLQTGGFPDMSQQNLVHQAYNGDVNCDSSQRPRSIECFFFGGPYRKVNGCKGICKNGEEAKESDDRFGDGRGSIHNYQIKLGNDRAPKNDCEQCGSVLFPGDYFCLRHLLKLRHSQNQSNCLDA